MNPECRQRETQQQHSADEHIDPNRHRATASCRRDHRQESNRTEQLHARRQTRQPSALLQRGDVGQQRGIRVDGNVEEDREQKDDRGQQQQIVDERPGDEEHRRKRNANQDERPATAETRPHAVGQGADRRLDDCALDAACTRQQPDEQVGRAKRFQNRRQNKVIEGIERARPNRPRRIEELGRHRQVAHSAPILLEATGGCEPHCGAAVCFGPLHLQRLRNRQRAPSALGRVSYGCQAPIRGVRNPNTELLSSNSGRRRADSNRRSRFCRPLPCHLATSPGTGAILPDGQLVGHGGAVGWVCIVRLRV